MLAGVNRPDWVAGEIAAHALGALSLGLYRDALEDEVHYRRRRGRATPARRPAPGRRTAPRSSAATGRRSSRATPPRIIGDNRPDWVAGEIAAHALGALSLGLYRDALEDPGGVLRPGRRPPQAEGLLAQRHRVGMLAGVEAQVRKAYLGEEDEPEEAAPALARAAS
jgi:hypothetical protein